MKTQVQTEMIFDVPARDLWEAITNASNFKKWYFHIPHFSTTPGDSFDFYDSESKTHFHHCTVLECIPGKKFVHTFQHPNESKGNSTVTWLVTEIDETHSKLVLTHEGTETFADAGPNFTPENYQMGWDAIIKTSLRNYLYLIEKLHFSININAPKETVWKKLWGKESFTTWTKPFCQDSYFEGEIAPNNRIHFLTSDGSGMYSDVLFFKDQERVIFKHIGDILNFKEQELDETSKHWTGCFESYRLMEINDSMTELEVEMDVTDSHLEFMRKHFPEGLEVLKEICES